MEPKRRRHVESYETGLIRAAAGTDIGEVRDGNEDRLVFIPKEGVYAVIDGVGGEHGGEIAAEAARTQITKALAVPRGDVTGQLKDALLLANDGILNHPQHREFPRMSCVATVARLDSDRVSWGHVGDTRLYLIDNGIQKLTRDQSPIGELEDRKEISEVEAMSHPKRNEVYHTLGEGKMQSTDGIVQVGSHDFTEHGAILLCSDGLTDLVTSERIAEIVDSHPREPRLAIEKLLDEANAEGGKDNITVVLVLGFRFGAEDDDWARTQRVSTTDDVDPGEFDEALLKTTPPDADHTSPDPRESRRRRSVPKETHSARLPDSDDIERDHWTPPRTKGDPDRTAFHGSHWSGISKRPDLGTDSDLGSGTGSGTDSGSDPDSTAPIPRESVALAGHLMPKDDSSHRNPLRNRILLLVALLAVAVLVLGPLRSAFQGSRSDGRNLEPITVASGASIQAAIDSARPGQEIRVEPGTYSEQLRIDKSVRLISSRRYEARLVVPADASSPRTAVHFAGPDSSLLQHFLIESTDEFVLDCGVRIEDGVVQLQEVRIVGADVAAVWLSGSSTGVFRILSVQGGSGRGVRSTGVANLDMEDCTVLVKKSVGNLPAIESTSTINPRIIRSTLSSENEWAVWISREDHFLSETNTIASESEDPFRLVEPEPDSETEGGQETGQEAGQEAGHERGHEAGPESGSEVTSESTSESASGSRSGAPDAVVGSDPAPQTPLVIGSLATQPSPADSAGDEAPGSVAPGSGTPDSGTEGPEDSDAR